MTLNFHLKRSAIKHQVIGTFKDHVSSGKAAFFQKYGMDFVMGRREGAFIWDIDGSKRLFNLHCNGGVFNLGYRNNELIEVLKAGLDDYDIGNHYRLWRNLRHFPDFRLSRGGIQAAAAFSRSFCRRKIYATIS